MFTRPQNTRADPVPRPLAPHGEAELENMLMHERTMRLFSHVLFAHDAARAGDQTELARLLEIIRRETTAAINANEGAHEKDPIEAFIDSELVYGEALQDGDAKASQIYSLDMYAAFEKFCAQNGRRCYGPTAFHRYFRASSRHLEINVQDGRKRFYTGVRLKNAAPREPVCGRNPATVIVDELQEPRS